MPPVVRRLLHSTPILAKRSGHSPFLLRLLRLLRLRRRRVMRRLRLRRRLRQVLVVVVVVAVHLRPQRRSAALDTGQETAELPRA